MDKNNLNPAFKEFESAWQEFFKNKQRPKSEKKDKMQQEEFIHWYNFIRKQSDTGKTPAEMYKEIYGKEPTKDTKKFSRLIKFEWDENYREPDELLQEAQKLINKGKYVNALKNVDEVLGIIQDDEDALLMKLEILNNLGKFEEGEKLIKNVISKKEGLNAYISFYRSMRYVHEANFIKALEYMQGAYEQEPDNFDFVTGLANYLYFVNDKSYKIFLDKAIKIDKKRADNFLKKFWLEPKIFMKGPFVFASIECISKLMYNNNIEEAEKNIKFILSYERIINKDLVKMFLGLQIECLLIKKEFDKALTKIEELDNRNGKNPKIYFYMALLYYKQSKLDQALIEIDKALEMAEDDLPHPEFYSLKSNILKAQDNDEYLYYENKAKKLIQGNKILREAFEELRK